MQRITIFTNRLQTTYELSSSLFICSSYFRWVGQIANAFVINKCVNTFWFRSCFLLYKYHFYTKKLWLEKRKRTIDENDVRVKKWRIDNVKLRNFCTFALIYGWFAQQLTHMKIWLNVTLLSLSSLVESWWWPPSLWGANPSSQRNQLMKARK